MLCSPYSPFPPNRAPHPAKQWQPNVPRLPAPPPPPHLNPHPRPSPSTIRNPQEQFIIAKTTARYASILAAIPQVCSRSRFWGKKASIKTRSGRQEGDIAGSSNC